jgi:hypothetical protein
MIFEYAFFISGKFLKFYYGTHVDVAKLTPQRELIIIAYGI